MTGKQEIDESFQNKTTPEVAQDLLGMYLEHNALEGRLARYIVDTKAYLGPEDEVAHSYGLRRTSCVRVMYEKPDTIYLCTIHTHRTLNIIIQPERISQGVMVHATEPAMVIEQVSKNRGGRTGPDIGNGPGELVEILAAPQGLYGQPIADSSLRLVLEKKKILKKIDTLPRIGILNKGERTEKPLRFVTSGDPYISLQRKSQIEEDWDWGKENEKEGFIDILR